MRRTRLQTAHPAGRPTSCMRAPQDRIFPRSVRSSSHAHSLVAGRRLAVSAWRLARCSRIDCRTSTEVCMRYALIVLFTAFSMGSGQQAADSIRDTFLRDVDKYVALHRQLEIPLPPEIVTADLEALFAPRITLSAALRAARADACHGEIFTPATAHYFRRLVADTLKKDG